MLNDVVRAKAHMAQAAIRAWTGFIADVAEIRDVDAPDGWRIEIVPQMPGACSVKLRLRNDDRYDLTVGAQRYDARPIASREIFLPLLEAVADGNVTNARFISTSTGLVHSVETEIRLADGTIWRDRDRKLELPGGGSAVERQIQTYLPYRRG